MLQLAGRSAQDMARDRGALRQELETYEALRAELDRRDPAGASRRAAETGALEARIAEESRIFAERLASPEAKAAMSAFLEKRKG